MSVRELKSESIPADDRHVAKSNIFVDAFAAKYLFASPFINARCTGATAAKLCRAVLRAGSVRPFDRDLAVGLFNNLCGFNCDGFDRSFQNIRLPFYHWKTAA